MKNEVVLSRELEVLRKGFGDTILDALKTPEVVEVMVNADGRVWVDKIGSVYQADFRKDVVGRIVNLKSVLKKEDPLYLTCQAALSREKQVGGINWGVNYLSPVKQAIA